MKKDDDAGDKHDVWAVPRQILDKIKTVIWNITLFCLICYAGIEWAALLWWLGGTTTTISEQGVSCPSKAKAAVPPTESSPTDAWGVTGGKEVAGWCLFPPAHSVRDREGRDGSWLLPPFLEAAILHYSPPTRVAATITTGFILALLTT
ncbi:hypothetical protein E2C01_002189 [Portunus trituberculatus]|uniref:Uncharacterized protein n=1 Tax=Portunus trituberculatus TaxID=210409 RepID=A0A5B7CLJ3_PORTR|nr:hypothetical protein [Portunus trituberculatus]